MDTANFITRSEQVLRAAGQRITNSRRRVATAIAEQVKGFSIKDIHQHLGGSEKSSLEFSTVYRTMETFAELGLIHAIQNQGKYVICKGDSSEATVHVLMHCRSCDDVDEELLSASEAVVPRLIDRKRHFHTDRSTIDLFGSCSTCS